MTTRPHDISFPLRWGVAFRYPLIFFSLFFISFHLAAQEPCTENRLIEGVDLMPEDECFEYSFNYQPYYFGDQTPSPSTFQVSYLRVDGELEGDGYITGVIPDGDWANFAGTSIGADGRSFSYFLLCTEPNTNQPQYTVDYLEYLFHVIVQAAPSTANQSNVVSIINIVTESYTLPTGIGSCANPPTPCTWMQYSTPLELEVPVLPTCPGLTIELEGLPLNGEQAPPHEEVGPVTVILTNNTGADITIGEFDFLLKVTDEFASLPDITPYMFPNVPANGAPLHEWHDGDDHYYHIDELMGGNVLPAGQEVAVLAFDILPPEGMENIEGLSSISIEFFRIKYEGSSGSVCCGADVSGIDEQLHFLGEQPCTPIAPYVSFDIVPLAAGVGYFEDCEVGFDVVIRIQDDIGGSGLTDVPFDQIYLEIETPVSGNMMHSEVVPDPITGFEVCPAVTCPSSGSSCYGCGGARIIFDFNNPSNPLVLDDMESFTVILSGLNGSLDGAEIKQAKVKQTGMQGACIPNIYPNDPGDFPLESGCNFCDNVQIEKRPYSAPPSPPLQTCEKAFSVYLNTVDMLNEAYGRITVELELFPSGNTTLTVQSALCSLCVQQNGNTVLFDYTPSTPIAAIPNLHVLDVYVTGVGCIDDAMFTASTEVDLYFSGITCNPKEYSPNNPLQQGGLCTTCFNVQYTVGGSIHDEDGDGVDVPIEGTNGEGAGIFIVGEVEAAGDCDAFNDGLANCTDITSTNGLPGGSGGCGGTYDFEILCNSDDKFTVIPHKDINVLNGVTTFDAVLIQKHVTGSQPLSTPYRILASDVNNSGTTTTFDAVLIRKLILQYITEFPNSTSWRFIDAAYQFPDPFNPWLEDFPECIHIDLSAQSGQANVDFVAIKIGDVNSSHKCWQFTESGTQDRSPGFPFVLGDVSENDDGTVEVSISVGSGRPVVAWQMGLAFDTESLRLLEALPGNIVGMSGQNLGLTEVGQGRIRALWYTPDAEPMSFDGEPAVLTLRFEKLRSFGNMPDVLWLDDKVLRSEAYDNDGTARPLHFITPEEVLTTPSDPTVFSATVSPNPFREGFALTVNMLTASNLQVTVADRYGRQVAGWEGEAGPGRYDVPIDGARHWPAGLYHWQARSADGEVSGQVLKQ